MEKLTKKQLNTLRKHNIDPKLILSLLAKIRNNKISFNPKILNRCIKLLSANDFTEYSSLGNELKKIGISAIQNGYVRYDIANGGAATRYYDLNKCTPEEIKRFKQLKNIKLKDINQPKCFSNVISGLNYLDLKLFFHLKNIYKKYGIKIPVHIMNNYSSARPVKEYIKKGSKRYNYHFPIIYSIQSLYPRLTYCKNLNFSPPGHGEYLKLVKSTLNNKKIKYIIYSNIDNLGAVIDPKLLGFHIQSGSDMTIEICQKLSSDEGGMPLIVNGKPQIAEQFKLPGTFNQSKIPYFNCATYIFTADALRNLKIELPWYLILKQIYKYPEKSFETEKAYQLEQLLGDLSMYLTNNFIIVPRKKRFWPVKRYCDLLYYLYPNKNNKFEMEQHCHFMKLLREEYNVQNVKLKAKNAKLRSYL